MIGSPQQLGVILFDKLKLSRKRRGKTGYSAPTRASCRRSATSTRSSPRSSATGSCPSSSRRTSTRCRTGSATTAACTRRSSRRPPPPAGSRSINPNLQNIPIRTETGREIRACFIPEPGNVLLSVDYSQVELRVLAHIANEQVLRDIFARGEDVHTETASAVFELPPEQLDVGMRSKAKMVNYGIVYGLSAYGLADRLRIDAGRGAGVHRPLPRALPGRRAVHEGRRHPGRAARLRLARSSAAAARSPRSAPATGRCASSASGSPSTP